MGLNRDLQTESDIHIEVQEEIAILLVGAGTISFLTMAETFSKATGSHQGTPANEQIQQPKSAIGISGTMAFSVANVDIGSPAQRVGLKRAI